MIPETELEQASAPAEGEQERAAAPPAPAVPPPAPAPPAPPVNKWAAVGDEIAKLGTATLGELSPTEPEPEPEKQPEGKAAEEPEGEKAPAPEEPEPTAPEPYSVVATDGAEFDFEPLPEGAKIVFTADGRKVEVDSIAELVTLAQQGAALRKVEGTYQKKVAGQAKAIAALTNRLQAADQAFRDLVEDEDGTKLEQYRARARKLTDPEYREGLEAKRQLEAKHAQEAEESEAVQEQVANEFWAQAQNQYTAQLKHYPVLQAEDFPDVVRSFWQGFEAHRAELADAARAELGTEDLTPEQVEAIDRHAIAWLTEENLHAHIRALAEKMGRRTGRGTGNGRRAATAEEAAKAEAEAHNKHVDDKLRQRDTRTLRGKGSPPGPGAAPAKRPSTWQEHMASIHEEFDKAKRAGVVE